MADATSKQPASSSETPEVFGRKYSMARGHRTAPKTGFNKLALLVFVALAVAGLLSLITWLTP